MEDRVRVLIVDDSTFFRKRIREQLERVDRIVVAGEASNGHEAIAMSARLAPDLITMDVAMPEMDGISAVREIMRTKPTDILMISALTQDGARSTLEALDAGAVDFLPKHGCLDDGSGGSVLGKLVIDIVQNKRVRREASAEHGASLRESGAAAYTPTQRRGGAIKLVVIGASTGGPVAIQHVLSALPADYPYGVLVGVHMPAEFTGTFAERLNAGCAVNVALATDGRALLPGRVMIAPGGKQTLVEQRRGALLVKVMPGGEQLYTPSIDILFGSAARALEDAVHAVILTGMGTDGTEGARLLKEHGANVWSQDQASSVVYGMPHSVSKAGLTDRVLALQDIGPALAGLA